jgi:hypothetical protein
MQSFEMVSIYGRVSKVNVVVIKADGRLYFFHNLPTSHYPLIYLMVIKVRNKLRFWVLDELNVRSENREFFLKDVKWGFHSHFGSQVWKPNE